MPSPFKSWWKLVSSDSSAALVPDTAPTIFEVIIAVAVSRPHRILICSCGSSTRPHIRLPSAPRRSASTHQTDLR